MGERADALAERLLGSLLGTMEVFTIYLGDRLGLYAALAEGPATPGDLAARAGIAERYAREWLEQQAVTGLLEVDDAAASASDRRYVLPAEHVEVLLDRDALTYLTPDLAGVGRGRTADAGADDRVPRRRGRQLARFRSRHERGPGV